MKYYPKRTYKTNLSNDELLILDFLFSMGNAMLKHLTQENYSYHMNVLYSHGIDDLHLIDKMNQLLAHNYVRFTPDYFEKEYERYELTKTGGKLWEVERTPVWERYCRDAELWSNNNNYLEIVCTNKKIGLELAKVSLECGICLFQFSELELIELTYDEVISWKKFKNLWMWKVSLYPDPDFVDYDKFESKRIWWGDIKELQKFV